MGTHLYRYDSDANLKHTVGRIFCLKYCGGRHNADRFGFSLIFEFIFLIKQASRHFGRTMFDTNSLLGRHACCGGEVAADSLNVNIS